MHKILLTTLILFTSVVVVGGLVLQTFQFPVLQKLENITSPFRVAFLVFEYVFVLLFFASNPAPFIYFQF